MPISLLVNKTNTNFITSDNPVMLLATNAQEGDRDKHARQLENFQMRNLTGHSLYFPLTPRLAVLGPDPAVETAFLLEKHLQKVPLGQAVTDFRGATAVHDAKFILKFNASTADRTYRFAVSKTQNELEQAFQPWLEPQ